MSEKLYQGCEPRIIERVPIHLKMVLTIREAAEYSNIGINKIESMLRQPNCPFVLYAAWMTVDPLRPCPLAVTVMSPPLAGVVRTFSVRVPAVAESR